VPDARDRKLAALRKIIPESAQPWDEHADFPGEMARRLNEIAAVLWPQPTVRARMVAYVARAGTARAGEIGHACNVPPTGLSRHLEALVEQGRLRRTGWGTYAIPAQVTGKDNPT
jgi:hypothetical protein